MVSALLNAIHKPLCHLLTSQHVVVVHMHLLAAWQRWTAREWTTKADTLSHDIMLFMTWDMQFNGGE